MDISPEVTDAKIGTCLVKSEENLEAARIQHMSDMAFMNKGCEPLLGIHLPAESRRQVLSGLSFTDLNKALQA